MKRAAINDSSAPPKISALWLRWFSAYGNRYVRRHFHAIRVRQPPPPVSLNPLVIYLNHASWWDPMVAFALRRQFFAHRHSFAPIDAEALEKYRFFRKLGLFPVRQNSPRGTMDFLHHASAILARADSILWLTPQGRFCDARERPARFRAGLGHLATRVSAATYLPLAIEYVFWEERKPEICVHFGEAVVLTGAQAASLGPEQVTRFFEEKLAATQDELAHAVKARDVSQFRTLHETRTGVGGVYDWWRRGRALLRQQTFEPNHGTK